MILSQASDFFKDISSLEGKVYVEYANELFDQAEILADGVAWWNIDIVALFYYVVAESVSVKLIM